jgi:hypothetical protein
MSLKAAAKHLAAHGRNGDTTLVHMTPDEVRGLQQVAKQHGTSLTINPHTGLPEAFSLSGLAKAAAPIALGAFLGPAGAAYGGGLFATAAGAGLAVGGAYALGTGSLEKGLMAGLSAYGAADISTAAADAAAKEEAAKQIATQESYVTNELAAQKAAENSATSGAVQASATPGVQGAQTAELANANAYNAEIDPIGRIASTYSTPASGLETLVNNPDAVAKQMGGYGKMAASGLMAAAPILSMQPEAPGLEKSKTAYIRPKTAYRDAEGRLHYVDLPSVHASDWGDKTINEYVESQVAPTRYAADGGMMGAVNPYSDDALAYNNSPVVRMANGGVSDADIASYVSAHIDDPAAIAAAAQQYGVSAEDLSRATGYSGEQVGSYFSNAGYNPETFNAYNQFTDAQMGSYFADPANANVNVADAVKQFNADPNAVNQYVTGLTAGYKDPTATQKGTGYLPQYENLIKSGMTAGEFSAAARGLNQDWGKAGTYWNPTTVSHAYEVADKILAFDPQTDKVTPSDKEWVAFMDQNKFSVDDISRATGLSTNEVQRRYDAAKEKPVIKTPIATPTPGGGSTTGGGRTTDTYTGGVTTTPGTYAPPGTETPYGNYINPGDLTINADKSRTVTPNIPGRPYGGFTGIGQVRDAYTAGGGNLGQTLAPTKSYSNAGQSADAYRYLFGETATRPHYTQERQTPLDTFANIDSPTDAELDANSAKSVIWQGGKMITNPHKGKTSKAAKTVTAPATEEPSSGAKAGGLMAAYAAGGQAQYNLGGYSDGGRLLRGPGDGVSDSIPATIGGKQPARLADGEFVVPARIVSEIGNGSTEAGARKLYAMMDRVQKARGKTVGKGKVAKNTRADKYLPG